MYVFFCFASSIATNVFQTMTPNPKPEETWFYMSSAAEINQKDTTADRISLSASANIDGDCLQALIDTEDGLLKPGAMPKVHSKCCGVQEAVGLNGQGPGGNWVEMVVFKLVLDPAYTT